MKGTEKIINQCEVWATADGTDRASIVIMADMTHNDVDLFCYGNLRDMARLVTHLMNEDKETGHAIYVAACLYAHKHIEAKERKKINAFASAIAEEDE